MICRCLGLLLFAWGLSSPAMANTLEAGYEAEEQFMPYQSASTLNANDLKTDLDTANPPEAPFVPIAQEEVVSVGIDLSCPDRPRLPDFGALAAQDPVPEPLSLALMGTAFGALSLVCRRRRGGRSSSSGPTSRRGWQIGLLRVSFAANSIASSLVH